MKRSKIKQIEQWNLTLTYTCPNTGNKVIIDVNPDDFNSSESPCEMCGSHGGVSLSLYTCHECKQNHGSIDITSW